MGSMIQVGVSLYASCATTLSSPMNLSISVTSAAKATYLCVIYFSFSVEIIKSSTFLSTSVTISAVLALVVMAILLRRASLAICRHYHVKPVDGPRTCPERLASSIAVSQ